MHRIAMLFLAASLSIGASRCDDPDKPPPEPVTQGQGAAGGAAQPGNDSPPAPRPVCGGVSGRDCPGVGMCVGGRCSCAVTASCVTGHVFNGSPDVCDCVPAPGGEPNNPSDAGMRDPGGERCGKNTCPAGQECCNESCGICAPRGGVCTQQFCEDPQPPDPDPDPVPVKCGTTTCAASEECCNASCGICTKPGEGCTKQLCQPDDPGDPGDEPIPGRPCDTKCEVGQHCEYEEVVCIRAPCPPLPSCVDSPQCGGFAGFTCPGGGMCEDDPRDDCDPNNGGADCGGLCHCALEGLCKDGQVWNASPNVCGCEPAGGGGGGEQCGKNTCEQGMVCCNASCGICAPPNGACIQIACI